MEGTGSYPSSVPEGVDGELWRRWVQGCRAYDELWSTGARCPGNPNRDAARCLCAVPKDKICRYWWALGDLAARIGGATLKIFLGMD